MAENARPRRRWSPRLRGLLWVLGGLLLAGLIALLVSVYLLLQPDRFTAMLQAQARHAGLELNLASPASPTLFPRPALVLQGLTLNAQGAGMPILLAARGRLVLPWHTLLGGPTVISRLEIDAPRVDLNALQSWLASLPADASATPSIPRIDAGVSISRGTVVRGDSVLFNELSLEAGSLLSGQPFPLTVSARDAAGTPLQLRLSATPRIEGSALQLNDIALRLVHGSAWVLQLAGRAHWHGAADAAASLSGKLDHADAGQFTVAATLTPAGESNPLLLALKLDGPGNHLDLRLPPLAWAAWWSQLQNAQGPQLSVPPGSGTVDMASLDAVDVHIEGLSLMLDDRAPAAAESAAQASSAAIAAQPAPAKMATPASASTAAAKRH